MVREHSTIIIKIILIIVIIILVNQIFEIIIIVEYGDTIVIQDHNIIQIIGEPNKIVMLRDHKTIITTKILIITITFTNHIFHRKTFSIINIITKIKKQIIQI